MGAGATADVNNGKYGSQGWFTGNGEAAFAIVTVIAAAFSIWCFAKYDVKLTATKFKLGVFVIGCGIIVRLGVTKYSSKANGK